MPDHFLVTGAMGCIGAWVVRNLVREGTPVVVFDLATDPKRIKLLLDPDELNRVTFITGDITDLPDLERALDEHAITHVIHLAALQIPFCRADAPLGARHRSTAHHPAGRGCSVDGQSLPRIGSFGTNGEGRDVEMSCLAIEIAATKTRSPPSRTEPTKVGFVPFVGAVSTAVIG